MRISTRLPILVTMVFVPAISLAAVAPVQKCAGAKLGAVSKAAKSLLSCHRVGVLKGSGPKAECIAKAEQKLADAYAKAELDGGCAVTGDLGQAEDNLETCVGLFSYLEAIPCGDTAGPSGEDVPCICGGLVVTNTTLDDSDPVTATTCGGNGLVVSTGIALNLGAKTLHGAGAGVGLQAGAGAIVTNGIVQGFETGMSAASGSVTITGVQSNGNAGTGLVVGQDECGSVAGVTFSGAAAGSSNNGGAGILIHPCASLSITGPDSGSQVSVLQNGGNGIEVRGALTTNQVNVGANAGNGIDVDTTESVDILDTDIHDSGHHPTLPAAGGVGLRVLQASHADGLVVHSTSNFGRTFIRDNLGHGVTLGDAVAQTGAVSALIGDAQIHDNQMGIRIQQKDDVSAWTESTILSNNIYDNRDIGLYVSTSRQKPVATPDRRVISSNEVHHNAVVGTGCLSADADQLASQVVFDGRVIGADPAQPPATPDSSYPDDYTCYWGTDGVAPEISQTQCDRMNDPEDVLSGGINNHCLWNGTQCRLAWDISGPVGIGECGTSDNRIYAYVNDPVQPELTQKGLAAINGAYVLARRNTWGVGGADNATFAETGTDSRIDHEESCSTSSACP